MVSKRLFLLFLVFFVSYFSFSQCQSGDVLLNHQTDVEQYLEDYGACETIEGNLFIGDGVTDISGITSIKRIEGSLIVSYADITDMRNFASLEYVGGDFRVEYTEYLRSIEGINNLHNVGGDFRIMWNYTALKTIRGFNALETIGGNFEINLNFQGIERIEAFDNLVHVGGWFSITNNNVLEVITGFNKLKKIGEQFHMSYFDGNLTIESNALLTEINGFNALTEVVRNLEIAVNPSLKKIAGFSNLKSTRYLVIGASPDLTVIPDFQKLTIVEGIEITRTGLTVLEAFNNVIVMEGHLNIMNNNDLTTISGFEKLTRIYGLDIISNPNLKSLIGLSNLIESTGINIQENESLENLQGLEKLFTVGLVTGHAITIAGNDSLFDCSAICNLLTNGTIYGVVSIVNNPSKCSSEAEVKETCIPDFDDDGILDDDDLDDDNDGILDVVEQNGDYNRDTDGDGYPDHRDRDSDGDGCYDVLEAGFTDGDDNGTLGSSPDNVDENGLITGAADGYTPPLDNNGNGVYDFQENNVLSAGEDAAVKICINSNSIDLFKELKGNPDIGGIWSPELTSGSGIFDPSVDETGIYTYTLLNGICGEDAAKVDVEVEFLNNSGENSSIQICKNDGPINLLEKLNGNPDQGGAWTFNSGSVTGIFDPLRDAAGTYIYTVANGICAAESAHIVISLTDGPNAGESGSLLISSNSEPLDLFNSLGGNPDAGGIWKPALSNGNGMFDPTVDNEGTYTYTVGNDPCGMVSSEVMVTINFLPNAGGNANIEICQNSAGVALFENLEGNPDVGGIWSPALSGGNGIFNPEIDQEGVYTYTVTNEDGDMDSSEVIVEVNPLPDSGESASVEICVNAGILDLFSSLGGNPQRGGIWAPALSSGDGNFDPAIDREGVYVYRVSSQTCGTSDSQVYVTVTEYEPIANYEVKIKEFSENNSVEVLIDSDIPYEYSLDGRNFQRSNLFSRVPGGLYSLYAREIGGCGMLQKEIAILDYLKFFTPNNDGYNDTWNLIGKLNRNLSYIKIYDRYGKLIINFSPEGKGWDGTMNGTNMPADDYWFEVVVSDQIKKTGHFSLIR